MRPYSEVKKTLRQGDDDPIWHISERVPHPDFERLLTDKNHLIVIRHGEPPFRVVFGAPHHVPSGQWRICEEQRDQNGNINDRKGDDNVASFALVAFSRLKMLNIPCKLVIMARASGQDPNKVIDTPYCQEIFREAADLLFECHAASSKRYLELELSAGSNQVTETVNFGYVFAKALEYRYHLGVQSTPKAHKAMVIQPGGPVIDGKLQLPAIKTTSLRVAGERGLPALHLETKPTFRVERNAYNSVSPNGLILGRAMATAIAEFQGAFKKE